MPKLQKTQIIPTGYNIRDKNTRNWASKLTFFLDKIIRQISEIPFNEGDILEVDDTGTADTEFSVKHYLDVIPRGFITVYVDGGGVVYDSGTAWTEDNIYLMCSVANAHIKIMVF